jgi:hypothetical protein
LMRELEKNKNKLNRKNVGDKLWTNVKIRVKKGRINAIVMKEKWVLRKEILKNWKSKDNGYAQLKIRNIPFRTK